MEVITQKEWNSIHKDYKSIINGKHYILKLESAGTSLVPVEVISDNKKR